MIPGAGRAVGHVDSLPVGREMKQEAPPERRGVVHLLYAKTFPTGSLLWGMPPWPLPIVRRFFCAISSVPLPDKVRLIPLRGIPYKLSVIFQGACRHRHDQRALRRKGEQTHGRLRSDRRQQNGGPGIAVTIADVTSFNTLIEMVIDDNPFGCIAYTNREGEEVPAVVRNREHYTAK